MPTDLTIVLKDRPGEEEAWGHFVADLRLAARYLQD